jgi:hypothetical protein
VRETEVDGGGGAATQQQRRLLALALAVLGACLRAGRAPLARCRARQAGWTGTRPRTSTRPTSLPSSRPHHSHSRSSSSWPTGWPLVSDLIDSFLFLSFWFPLIQCGWPPSNPLGPVHLTAATTQHAANGERRPTRHGSTESGG